MLNVLIHTISIMKIALNIYISISTCSLSISYPVFATLPPSMQTSYLKYKQYDIKDAPREAFLVAVNSGGKLVDLPALRKQWGLQAQDKSDLPIRCSVT